MVKTFNKGSRTTLSSDSVFANSTSFSLILFRSSFCFCAFDAEFIGIIGEVIGEVTGGVAAEVVGGVMGGEGFSILSLSLFVSP